MAQASLSWRPTGGWCRRRIQRIVRELEGVRQRRILSMERRKKANIPMATLVGYTNAGKSTLFNALSDAKVDASARLFATLDPTTRRIRLPSDGQLLLTDTVGFIQKLSPQVVAAFRATLEEIAEADILLHVVDITHPTAPEQVEVVESTLRSLGLEAKPSLLVVNKMDLLTPGAPGITSELLPKGETSRSVFVSAAKGWNLDLLLGEIESGLMTASATTRVERVTGSAAAG